MDKVVHFEIPFDSGSRAKSFYQTVFGWQLQEIPGMEYTSARTVAVDEKQKPKEAGAINGGMMKRTEVAKSPVVFIGVADIDESLKKIQSAGGIVAAPKVKAGDMGYYAYVKDTEGNLIGVWQNLK